VIGAAIRGDPLDGTRMSPLVLTVASENFEVRPMEVLEGSKERVKWEVDED
jgi:hypothetical protein